MDAQKAVAAPRRIAPERRKRMVPDERREQILSCARRLFGDKPYAQVSLSEVATEAGVARGLINHYFGGKRELYLEVLRSMIMVPDVALDVLPKGTLDERINGIVDHFLTVIQRHRAIWLTTVSLMAVSRDDDIAQVTFEAEEATVDILLSALGLAPQAGERGEVRAMIRAYGAMVRAVSYEWLARGMLSRPQAQQLLVSTMLTLTHQIDDLTRGAWVSASLGPRSAPPLSTA